MNKNNVLYKVLKYAIIPFLISLITVILSEFILKDAISGLAGDKSISVIVTISPLFFFFGLFFLLTLYIQYFPPFEERRRWLESAKSVLCFFLISACLGILMSILYGVIAVIMQSLFQNNMEMEKIGGILTWIYAVLQISILPILVGALLRAMNSSMKWHNLFKTKRGLPLYVAYLLVFLVAIPISVFLSYISFGIAAWWRTIIYSIYGAISWFVIVKIYEKYVAEKRIQKSEEIAS